MDGSEGWGEQCSNLDIYRVVQTNTTGVNGLLNFERINFIMNACMGVAYVSVNIKKFGAIVLRRSVFMIVSLDSI